MLAADVAHNDMLGPGGDFACHEMSHYITETFGVSHGAALAMILPAWCEHVSHKAPERFADFFSQVFSIKGCPSEAVIEPVSYTHLDVYKRQQRRQAIPAAPLHQLVHAGDDQAGACSPDRMPQGEDVYKRQGMSSSSRICRTAGAGTFSSPQAH